MRTTASARLDRRPRRPRFPPEVVARALALQQIHGLTLRETSSAMALRGIEVSHESLRAWGRTQADAHSAGRPAPRARWAAEVRAAVINGEPLHLWVARGPDGAVLEVLAQRSRNRSAAIRDLRRLLSAGGEGAMPPK